MTFSRAWDVAVGLTMIFGSLVAQFVVIFIFFGLALAGLLSALGVKSDWWIWAGDALAFLLLNVLTFRSFRRQRRPFVVLGWGGAFFWLPRGFYRIRHGRETYGEQGETPRGFPVIPAKPPERQRG